jgi:hypothetical protein
VRSFRSRLQDELPEFHGTCWKKLMDHKPCQILSSDRIFDTVQIAIARVILALTHHHAQNVPDPKSFRGQILPKLLWHITLHLKNPH